jgi:hypothetical protein
VLLLAGSAQSTPLSAVRAQLRLRLQEVESLVASSTGEYEALRKLAADEGDAQGEEEEEEQQEEEEEEQEVRREYQSSVSRT